MFQKCLKINRAVSVDYRSWINNNNLGLTKFVMSLINNIKIKTCNCKIKL